MKAEGVQEQSKLVDEMISGSVAELVDAHDSDQQLECLRGNPGSRTAQTRRSLPATKRMVIPSQAEVRASEGVETRRAAPKAENSDGEGIVQTPNSSAEEAAKAVAGKKIVYPYGCESSILSGATTYYQLAILNPDDANTEPTMKSLISGWLRIRYKEQTHVANRLQHDQLVESDLFYLNRFLQGFFAMARFRFRFIRSSRSSS